MKQNKFEKIVEQKFAYDVSGLGAYVEEQSPEIIPTLISGARTADIVPIQTGIKFKEKIKLMDTSITLQANDCGRNPLGNVILSNKELEVADIKININVCNKNLLGNWGQLGLKPGAMIEKEELPFGDQIISHLVKQVKTTNEKMIWQGDKGSGVANLNKIDGFVKIFKAAGVVNVNSTQTSWTTANIVAAMYKLRNALSTEVLEGNHRIFVGRELFDLYCLAQTTANLYHFDPVNNRLQVPLHGTNTMIELVPGLSGTNEAYAGLVDFMRIGTDLENDMEVFDVYYDRAGGGTIFIDIEYKLGVQFVYENQFKRLALVAS